MGNFSTAMTTSDSEDNIATHSNPARKSRADFIISAPIDFNDGEIRWEQFWAKQLGGGEYEICCIPFFTYGIALGDIVITKPRSGKEYVVNSVVRTSGRRLLRFWLGDAPAQQAIAFADWLLSHELSFECSSKNLIAVDVPDDSAKATLIEDFERSFSNSGILMEEG